MLIRGFVLLCASVVLAGLLGPGGASAAPNVTECDGFLAPGTYHRVVVPDDGACFSEGPVTIRGGLFVGEGATFVLGSEENAVDTGTINGGVQAINPASVQIHFTTINGGIDIQGGSGPFGGPFGITWTTIEDSNIHGHVNISGYDGFWMGFIRNNSHGSVTLNDNVLLDPDANEYVTNVIHGNLNCSGNSPAPQIGDSQGELNVVTGKKTGQCEVL
jgi:hypothetical protein